MKKSIPFVCTVLVFIFCTIPLKVYSYDQTQGLLDFGQDFILNAYSDFSIKEKDPEDFVAMEAVELQNFMNDREEILRLYTENSKKDINPLNSKLVESKIKDLGKGRYEACYRMNHTYLTGGNQAFTQGLYKLVLENKESGPQVLAAMSNDISAGYLLGSDAAKFEELDLDFQLEDFNRKNSSHEKYSLKEAKDNLRETLDEMKGEEKKIKRRSIFGFLQSIMVRLGYYSS